MSIRCPVSCNSGGRVCVTHIQRQTCANGVIWASIVGDFHVYIDFDFCVRGGETCGDTYTAPSRDANVESNHRRSAPVITSCDSNLMAFVYAKSRGPREWPIERLGAFTDSDRVGFTI